MNVSHPDKIVVLGLMSHFPVAGVIWQTMHYLVGLQRLGYDVYYVEAHGCAPTKLMQNDTDDGPVRAAAYIDEAMRRFGLEGQWAYDTRYEPRRVFGLTESQLNALYREAAIIINLHGGTVTMPENAAPDRLVYLETDPVDVQIDLSHGNRTTINYLAQHSVFFTFGENLGHADCRLPVSPQFRFLPTRQPVIMDFWESSGGDDATTFTTIGNWRQPWRERKFQGELYRWSKHFEFLKFIDLPARTTQPFELALSSYEESDRQQLESHGWRVRPALDIAHGSQLDAYRQYIGSSRGEFTVAKDQNIRLRSGWFSDRAATYLAAGRPVITQETGFSNILPTGAGLFTFSTMDEILQAVDAINADYPRQRRAALDIAREYFSHDVVLKRLLADIGLARRNPQPVRASAELVLSPTSRWPTRLPDATVQTVMMWSVPVAPAVRAEERPKFSIVIVTFNGLVYTRMCLTSLLLNTPNRRYEVIIVDNASTDGTPDYLREVAARNPHVHVIANDRNRGFAAANNQGLALARGDILVLLNNDTILSDGWLRGLKRVLDDLSVGLAGPVTNRTCNEAQIDAPYRTYEELLIFAHQRGEQQAGTISELPMLAMFCVAMRRDVFARVGLLDERFGIGMFEDDDYALRVRQAGHRVVCAEDTFVHHFGQGTIGELCKTGEYDALYEANRRRFEEKWGVEWKPHKRRITPEYEQLRQRIRTLVAERVPAGAQVIVVSKGDDELLPLNGLHFPPASIYPADSAEAITHLEALRAKGGRYLVVPKPGFWWLEHYTDFAKHLGSPICSDESCQIFALNHD